MFKCFSRVSDADGELSVEEVAFKTLTRDLLDSNVSRLDFVI